jgi:hypothetical protein
MSYLVPKQYTYLNVARNLLPPLTFTCLLWMTSINPVNLWQLALCVALLVIPWSSYVRWQRQKDNELPVFAMLSLMYWLYYAVALFWGDLTIRMARFVFAHESSPKFLSLALVMCLVGVVSLWIGMKSRIGRRIVPQTTPYLNQKRGQRNYLRGVLVASALLGVFETSTYVLGEGGRQLISLAMSFIPLLAFTLMFRLYLRREATQLDKVLVFGFLMVRLVVGLSSGWLANAASIMIICAAAYIAERHKIPRLAVMTVLLFTLFFQVGKEEFRSVYWYQQSQTQATQLDRVSFWVNASLEKWQSALTDPSGADLRELLNKSVSRVSLLAQSANVLEQTPDAVPYQYGQLYSYLVITFIPRFLWPEKPSVSEANRFYQVAYGLTAEEDLNNVAIGVGILTESFISFGWLGVIGIMFLVGIFFDFYQSAFLSKTSGVLMTSLGIALLPQMLGIESQMATYVGGIVQQVGLSLLVFLPIIKWRRARPVRFSNSPSTQVDQTPSAIPMNAGARS